MWLLSSAATRSVRKSKFSRVMQSPHRAFARGPFNSLTGWERPRGAKQHLLFKQMEEERDAASRVKTQVPILVILGNPPYDGFAGVSPREEDGLLDAYKHGLKA
jgi:hypothetical protein